MVHRFILPLLGDYVDSGYREPRDRMLYSLRSNARYQVIVFGTGAVALVYFVFQSGLRVTTNLKATIISLAYAWGLILAIYLMGHGLVAIPRGLYRDASTTRRLRHLQTQAPKVHDRLVQAIEDLDQLEAQVVLLNKRKTGTARDFSEWIEELADTSDVLESRVNLPPPVSASQAVVPAVITERYLADLTRKLKRARHKRIRFIEEWDRLVQEAKDSQAILDAANSRRLDFGRSSPSGSWTGGLKPLTPSTRYILHANIIPAIRYGLSGVLGAASVCIIWSELFKSEKVNKLSIVGMSIVHHPNSDNGKIGFTGQVMAACWLLYMCAAALSSMSEVKVWGNRALVRRNTYSESACWYACQVAKLTVPLSFNFITFIHPSIYEKTAFYQFLGRLIDVTPLGLGFSSFFPIFILVSVLATAFNLYGKVKYIAGFGSVDDEDDPAGYGSGGWREGRDLIDRETRNNDSLGLGNVDHSSLPTGRQALPQRQAVPSGAATNTATPPVRRERQYNPSRPLPADDDGSGNFFSDFAHRMKNTVDTTNKPDWMSKRPKWMGGVAGNTESSGRADFGQGLGRWFGGRPDDGRVRL